MVIPWHVEYTCYMYIHYTCSYNTCIIRYKINYFRLSRMINYAHIFSSIWANPVKNVFHRECVMTDDRNFVLCSWTWGKYFWRNPCDKLYINRIVAMHLVFELVWVNQNVVVLKDSESVTLDINCEHFHTIFYHKTVNERGRSPTNTRKIWKISTKKLFMLRFLWKFRRRLFFMILNIFWNSYPFWLKKQVEIFLSPKFSNFRCP